MLAHHLFTTDFVARAHKPVVNGDFATWVEQWRYEGDAFHKKYRNSLMRLKGDVVSVLSVEQKDRYGISHVEGTALLLANGAETTYLALFYKEETPKFNAVTSGYHVVMVCDRLQTQGALRMEGCTLESATPPADLDGL